MSSWQTTQKTMSDQYLKGMQGWQKSVDSGSMSNPMMDMYFHAAKNFFQPYENLTPSDSAAQWAEYFKELPNAQIITKDMQALIDQGFKLFENLTTDYFKSSDEEDIQSYLAKAFAEISSPKTWLQFSGDYYDLGIHKLSEGPFFSGVSDIDKRLANMGESWSELFQQSKQYHALVFDRWNTAYSRYVDELGELKRAQEEEVSPQQLIELWSGIANEELLVLHRSEDFLAAQKEVIRASMQYRLHEKEVAERICEAMHIPTRDEVDELHKTVTDLRRELRELKSELASKSKKPVPKKAVPKKVAPKRKAVKKPIDKKGGAK